MISVDWHYQTFICSTSEKVLANHTLIIGDIIYDNPVNESLINKLEKVQYQASWQLQVPFKARHVRVFTRNLQLNLYKVGSGIGKWYVLIKYSMV